MSRESIKFTRIYDMADVYILNGKVLKNRQGDKEEVDLTMSRGDKRIIAKENNGVLDIAISIDNYKLENLERELELIEKIVKM